MALIASADVKTFLKLTSTDFDTMIGMLATKVIAFIDGYLDRKIEETTYNELYRGEGGYRLKLDNYPVRSVAILSDSIDKENKKYSSPIGVADILIDAEAGILEFYTQPLSESIDRNVFVQYVAGYGGTGIGALAYPEELKLVACEIVAKKYYDYQEKRIGLQSKAIMGENISFSYQDVTAMQKDILTRYRRYDKGRRGMPVSAYALES